MEAAQLAVEQLVALVLAVAYLPDMEVADFMEVVHPPHIELVAVPVAASLHLPSVPV